jgi:hypothetical protein
MLTAKMRWLYEKFELVLIKFNVLGVCTTGNCTQEMCDYVFIFTAEFTLQVEEIKWM